MIKLKKVEGLNTTATLSKKRSGSPPTKKTSNRPPSGRSGGNRFSKLKNRVRIQKSNAKKMLERIAVGIRLAMERLGNLDPNNMIDRFKIEKLKEKLRYLERMKKQQEDIIKEANKAEKEIQDAEGLTKEAQRRKLEAEERKRREEAQKEAERKRNEQDMNDFLDS